MSKTVPPRPIVIDGKRTFIIVASQFNTRYVEGLVDHAKQELHVLAPNAAISVQRLPGAFEMPVVVGELASKGTRSGHPVSFLARPSTRRWAGADRRFLGILPCYATRPRVCATTYRRDGGASPGN